MSRELMPKSGIMMPHVVINRDAAVVGVSTVDGVAGAVNLTNKYLQKTDAENTYLTKTEGATKVYVADSIAPIMEGALFKADPFVANDVPFRSAGANGVESVDMIKVTPENAIKIGSYASSVQGVEVHTAGRLQVVDLNDGGVETKYPIYSKRYRPEIDELPFAAIGSYVKDSKGRTIGVNRTGINSDITQMTQKVTFTQPVTVADAVGDYDAVTLRQLRNSGGGSGGPTMSGISNFGIGDFHLRDSRAFIPAFEVVSDGQLLNRADYPDLWAYAQLLSPIEDSLWLSDKFKRGRYSTGDGSTTFRVPDRNGVQEGSIRALYARGDGGASAANGDIFESAAPNIWARTASYSGSSYAQVFGDIAQGAFKADNTLFPAAAGDAIPDTGAIAISGRYNTLTLDASKSSPIYGAATDEIMGRNFVGVWTIRAHGGFTAANTSWSVINSDSTEPPSGTPITGGLVSSKYLVGGVDKYRSSIQLLGTNEVNLSTRLTTVNDRYAIGAATWDFNLDGKLVFNKSLNPTGTGYSPGNTYLTLANTWMASAYSGYVGFVGGGVGVSNGGWRNFISLGSLIFPDSSHPTAVISQVYDYDLPTGNQPNGDIVRNTSFNAESYDITFGNNSGTVNYIFSKSPVSDENKKHDITPISTEQALLNINKMKYSSFIYNYDENDTVRRGFIAQQLEKIDSQYVRKYKDATGGETLSLDENVLLLDALAAIQELTKKVEALEAKLAEK